MRVQILDVGFRFRVISGPFKWNIGFFRVLGGSGTDEVFGDEHFLACSFGFGVAFLRYRLRD